METMNKTNILLGTIIDQNISLFYPYLCTDISTITAMIKTSSQIGHMRNILHWTYA